MQIGIASPVPPDSTLGNGTTARRWQRLLGQLGHDVQRVAPGSDLASLDALVALHAGRSAAVALQFRQLSPRRPLVLCLTGTDLYRDLGTSQFAQDALAAASHVVVLQAAAKQLLAPSIRSRTQVILQSAEPVVKPAPPRSNVFEVVVASHLRALKDPLRTAAAARLLPAGSRVHVVHAGRALEDELQEAAAREARENPRYSWEGEQSSIATRQLIARAQVVTLTSVLEGGANLISEAIASSVPILCSRISSSAAILGHSYPGFFPVGDTRALANLLYRAESDLCFLDDLRRRERLLQPLVSPVRERQAWAHLIQTF